jgi:hypothetical protein
MVNMTQEEYNDHFKRQVGKMSKGSDYDIDKLPNYYNVPTNKPNNIRPDQYGGKDNTYEVFNVLEAWNIDKDFYLGNVIKYVARAGKKDPSKTKEDLQKAMVYLQRKIDQL